MNCRIWLAWNCGLHRPWPRPSDCCLVMHGETGDGCMLAKVAVLAWTTDRVLGWVNHLFILFIHTDALPYCVAAAFHYHHCVGLFSAATLPALSALPRVCRLHHRLCLGGSFMLFCCHWLGYFAGMEWISNVPTASMHVLQQNQAAIQQMVLILHATYQPADSTVGYPLWRQEWLQLKAKGNCKVKLKHII